MSQKLLPFIENDLAKNEALSDILSAIIVSLEEKSEIDEKLSIPHNFSRHCIPSSPGCEIR